MEQQYTLEQLVEASGVSGRTIRYYITEQLLPGPVTQGRGAFYATRHLQILTFIREHREQHNRSLAEVKALLAQQSFTEVRVFELPPVTQWDEFQVAPDVKVSIKHGRSPHRRRQLVRALETFSMVITDGKEENEG